MAKYVCFHAAQTGKHLLRTQNVSEQNQKHFLCPGHKICVGNKCCARGQTGKHLCRQQMLRARAKAAATRAIFCLRWHIFERERPPNNLLFRLTTSLTSLESCTKSCPGTFNFRWNFHKCRLKPGETRPICFTAPCPWTTNCQQLESSIWTKFVTFTVPINSSLKLTRFKPSQPLMMSSGTSKWPKTQQFYAIWTHLQGNSADDLADQKANSNAPSVVTWPHATWQCTCIPFPVPPSKPSEKEEF